MFTLDGTSGYVVRLELEEFDEYVTVYNLEIDDFHTYFVGDAYDDADASVLVHNYKGNNKLKPNSSATGDHTTYNTDSDGNITSYQEWTGNPQNPNGFDAGKRFDHNGKPHGGIPTPHVHNNPNKGDIRPANPEDFPPNITGLPKNWFKNSKNQ